MVSTLSKPDYNGVKNEAFKVLGTLDPVLYPFHHRGHTFNDVLPAIEILAKKLGIYGEDLLILRTGGVLHDIGFTVKYWDNEPEGVDIANQMLPRLGYSSGLVEAVDGIITATSVPQRPKTPLQKAMCDADLFGLGTDDFWVSGDNLLRERIMHKDEIPFGLRPPKTWKEWYKEQLKFLERHHYHTQAARDLRNKGKMLNIRKLEVLLSRM